METQTDLNGINDIEYLIVVHFVCNLNKIVNETVCEIE